MSRLLEQAGLSSVAELAECPGVRDCLNWFSAQKHWIDDKHAALCRIPAPTFQEERRAEWMAGELAALGCAVRLDRAGNLIAGVPPASSGPAVAVTAHLDTVLAPRRPEDIQQRGDGRMYGPGVADNGAGLAALLALAGALNEFPVFTGRQPQLLLIGTVGEEGEGNLSGMRYLCRQPEVARAMEALIVLDGPSTSHVTFRAVASRRFEISVTGPGGHSWADFGAGNPVHALCRAITLFANKRGEIPPGASFNFGMIEGGTSVNSIPSTARAKLDLRSQEAGQIEGMMSLAAGSLERALEVENSCSRGPGLTGKIREIGSRPGGRLSEDSPILGYLRAVDAHLGIRAQLECGSSDANIPLSLGWPAVAIGAGGRGGGVHTAREWFDPAGRELGLKRIFLTICLLMKAVEAGLPVAQR